METQTGNTQSQAQNQVQGKTPNNPKYKLFTKAFLKRQGGGRHEGNILGVGDVIRENIPMNPIHAEEFNRQQFNSGIILVEQGVEYELIEWPVFAGTVHTRTENRLVRKSEVAELTAEINRRLNKAPSGGSFVTGSQPPQQPPQQVDPPAGDSPVNLDKMNRKQLDTHAKENGVPSPEVFGTKAEVIEAIKKAEEDVDQGS